MKSKYLTKIKEAIAEIEKSNAKCKEDRKHQCDNIIACGANGRDLSKHIDKLKEVHAMEHENLITFNALKKLLE